MADTAAEFFNTASAGLSSSCDAEASAVVRNVLLSAVLMDAERLSARSPSLTDAENRLALGAGAFLLLVGASRRSTVGAWLAPSSTPLLYRGLASRWPNVLDGYGEPDSTRSALGGDRGVHVRESIRLEVPVGDVYRFWRRLENLPQFMTHLDRAPAMYRTFRDKQDSCIKVVMKPGVATPHHAEPGSSRQQ